MKVQLSKYLCILFLIPSLVLANNNWKGKYTKEKKINKEFDVSADAALKISNSYGNLSVTSWNQNKVVIEVHIMTNGNNEEKVQKKLDQIDVDFEASRSLVQAKTIFNKSRTSSWWGSKKNNVNMKINYTIKVPVTNSVDLNNDYGHINLDKIEGDAKISCDYGRLIIGELLSNNNILSFDYTRKSTIEYMRGGKISADYSGFEIDRAGNLTISADYTDSTVKDGKDIKYSADYGSLNIGKANSVSGSGDYITTRLGSISGDVDITADYGSLRIEQLTGNAGNVTIRADYTGIKIGYAPDYHFNFEVRLEYASMRGGDDFDYKIKRSNSGDKYYQGHYGSAGSGKNISITADYGGVTFFKS
ncbi:hypothetical protein GWK08_11475 [Leptobacterium flavescens]|uniref:DUF4097 family beta strand repeat protein n=1 Tax=Leptobacterium flavescens TaxID=472055 RepID=A0A6P0UT82_9FLAO|nr:DUF4097 domain-containing protein [Leptobacterium flavescens]NER14063.1 hypothetical protein [Leptobacterium flavescens]